MPAIAAWREGSAAGTAGPTTSDAGWKACIHNLIHARSSRIAAPWPPPTQRLAMPRSTFRRRISSSSVRTSRAPVAPTGWPRAIAPPLTFSRSGSSSPMRSVPVQVLAAELGRRHRLHAREHLAGERLVDLHQRHVGQTQAPSAAAACRSRTPAPGPSAPGRAPRTRTPARSRGPPSLRRGRRPRTRPAPSRRRRSPGRRCRPSPMPSRRSKIGSSLPSASIVCPARGPLSRVTGSNPSAELGRTRGRSPRRTSRPPAPRPPSGASGGRTRPARRGRCRTPGRGSRRSCP